MGVVGFGELLVDGGWCGRQSETVGHIWRPPQGSKVTSDTPDLTLFSTGTFRFAYGRSDVVLMCFDIGRAQSLENCRWFWKTLL